MDVDLTENPDGNGYGTAQGYSVGQDLFRTLKPDRFRLSEWRKAQDICQQIPFTVDSSQPGAEFIVLTSRSFAALTWSAR